MPRARSSVDKSSVKPDLRGREAVRAAVIDHARTLFAQKGYNGVSIRDIAAAAGVNHGLIHRHFGAKSEVLRAVLQGIFIDVGRIAQLGIAPDDPEFVPKLYPFVTARKTDWQIMMRAVLDGFDFRASGFEFPVTTAMVQHVAARRGRNDKETRMRAGVIIAAGLGWILLEDYLSPILKLDKADRAKLHVRLAEIAESMSVSDC